jgi:hypothetical protein
MNFKRKLQLAFCLSFHSFTLVFAQPNRLEMHYIEKARNQAYFSNDSAITHTGIYPFVLSQQQLDSFTVYQSQLFNLKQYKRKFARKSFNESLLAIDTGEFKLYVDPEINFQVGNDRLDPFNRRIYTNTRGFRVRGSVGKSLSFYSSFYENQAFFPEYLSAYVREQGVVPGSGRTKNFKVGGFDYAMVNGLVSYRALDNWTLSFGHDKLFVGNGYRSMVLSDNAFNYPLLRSDLHFFKRKLSYTNVFMALSSLQRIPATFSTEAQFIRKAGSMHLLSFAPNKYIQFSFFENIIWQRWDSTQGTLAQNPLFFNPVLFTNTAVYGLQSSNPKVLGGINLKITPIKNIVLYGQFVADDVSKNRFAYQGGFSYFDAFSIPNLYVQAEFNEARPFTYTNQNQVLNYSHYSNPLAHPAGAGFKEWVAIIDYRVKRIGLHYKLNYYEFNRDSLGLFAGKNIFISENNTLPIANIGTYQQVHEASLSYLINPASGLQIQCGVLVRNFGDNNPLTNTQWFFISLRTHLYNTYFDF